MSDYGDGSQPPPPPYGGGSQGGQYGQPPQYGQQPPQYGQQPQYGQPQYGSPEPAPQQPYGAAPPPPPQPYGQPYGAAPAAPQGYGAPYGQPMGGFGAPASMGKRFAARLLDGLIIGIPLSIIYFALILPSVVSAVEDGSGTPPVGGLLLFQLVAIAVSIGYEMSLIATRGATIGKQLLGIKVIRDSDGQIPGWGPAALRWLIPTVGSFACGIGQIVVYLSPFWDSSGRYQGWHDKVAHTLVVQR